jgi:hypothetical protein
MQDWQSKSLQSMELNVGVQNASYSCHSKASNCITSHANELCSINGSIQDCASNVKDFENGVVNKCKLLIKHNSLQGYGKEVPLHIPSIQLPCVSKETQDGFSMLVGYMFFFHLFLFCFFSNGCFPVAIE